MTDEPDYYAALQVPPDADQTTIRLAYRRLARRYHPDIAGAEGVARMKAFNVAYQVLSDPEERGRYDLRRGLDRATAAAAPPAPSSARPTARPAAPPHPQQARRGVVQQTRGPLRLLATLEAPEPIPIAALAFAQGGLIAGLGLLDGRVLLRDLRAGRDMPAPSFGADSGGVLQELRLSPSGAYAAMWGLLLGTRVWRIADGATLWQTAINAPSGMMDGALLDGLPNAHPMLRLAVPDAPLALAAEDPFRWAVEGMFGTAVYSRPLVGPVSAAAAVPLRCDESQGGGLLGDAPNRGWRVRHRALSDDGRRLFTLTTGDRSRGERGTVLSLWDLDARTLLGAPTVKRVARISEAEGALTFPLATTADLAWIAASDFPVGLVLLSLRDRARRRLPTGPVRPHEHLALSPDAAYLAIGRDERLELWDTKSGQRAQELRFAAELTAVAFAGAAQPMLAVGLANGLAEVWG
jgi:curved DNA-binding protein CbpA